MNIFMITKHAPIGNWIRAERAIVNNIVVYVHVELQIVPIMKRDIAYCAPFTEITKIWSDYMNMIDFMQIIVDTKKCSVLRLSSETN